MSVEARRAKRAHRGLEVLEPRLLFSGNPLLPSEVESIRDGLAALETLGQRIDQQAVLADARGVFGAGLTPGNTQSLGDAFDASQSLRAAIVQPALDYFAQTANPSATGLRDAIDTALNGLAGVGQVTVESLSPPSAPTDSFEFDIDFSWTQGPAGALTIDLAEWVPAGLVQTNGVLEIEVSPTLEMGLTIGLDRGAASTAEGFYARFDQAPGANRLGLTFDAADGFTASGNIGALGITLGLDAASELFSFDVPFLAGAGNLSAAQLEASPLASTLVPAPLTPTPFVLTLPITVDAGIDGFDPQGAALLIRDFDLFDGLFDAQNGSDVVVINGDAFAPFRNLSIDALFNGLTGLEDTFTSLARNDAFNQAVPLLDSVGLGDLAPLGEAIAQRITAPAGNDTDAGGQAGQRGAAFTSLQALAGLVGNGLSYDPATRELVIDLSFSHLFASESVELGLSRGLGELDGFELSAGVVADVALQLDASFGLGISLETNGVASRSGIEPTPFIDASTPMSYFGLSVDTGTLNASGDDLRITLRDGTTAGFSLTDTPTLGQLLDSINAAFGPNLEASFETRTDPISGSAFNVGLRLEDKTTAGPNAALRVESVGGSLAAFALSIARSAPDGVIESGAIHGRGLIDQWFIRQHHADPFVQVTAQLTADDIDAGAMLGPVEIGIVDGTAAGQFGAALSLTQTSLTLREAMGLAPGDLAFAFTGSANLDLPFSASVAGLTLPASPRIAVSIPDLRADLSDASNLVVDLSEIGDLAALTGLDVGDFTTLLNGALDLLAGLDALEGLDFYNADLPLIDLSLSEAFDFAKAFEPVVSAFASDSGTTLNTVEQVIENLFGGQDVVDLSMDGDSAIRLDLRFDVGDLFNAFEDKLTLDAPLRLDLSTLSGDVEGMGDLIDFKAEADFGVEVGADVFISLGLDVSNPDNPRPFLYDANATNDAGTRIVATAEANATLNQFTASVGPFGVQIGNSDPLDPQAGVTIAGDFVIALADLDGSGRTYFDDLTAGTTPPGTLNLIGSVIGLGTLPTQLIDFEVSGSAQATLPISFPGLPIPEQVLTATIADLTQPSAIAFTGGDIFETARDALRGDFNLLNIVGGWDGALDLLINALDGELLGLEIPFVGDALGDQADFLRQIKDSVSSNLGGSESAIAAGGPTEQAIFGPVQSALFDALGPGGIGLLKDIAGDNGNPDGQITIDDVVITADLFSPTNPSAQFRLELGESLGLLDVPIDFDFGIPGLAFDLDANVQASVGFDFGLDFGVDLNDGFFINTDNTGLNVFLEVAVPGLSASGELGIFKISANELTDAQLLQLVDPANDPQGLNAAFIKTKIEDGQTVIDRERNGVFGSFAIDLLDPNANTGNANDDSRLTLSEITRVDSFSDIVSVSADIEANLNIGIEAEVGDSATFPSIRGNLLANVGYMSGEGFQRPELRIAQVELDLGEFFGGFAGDFFDQIDEVIDPVRPIVEALQAPIPVLSDLGEPVTFLDMAKLMGGRFAGAANFVDAVGDLIAVSDAVAGLVDEDFIALGGASLTFDAQTQGYAFTLDDANLFADIMNEVSSKAGTDAFRLPGAGPNPDKLDISFPILNPSNVIGMFTGQTVDLVTLELPTFDLDFTMSYIARLPIFPPLGVELAGSIGATIDLAFGFDSFGIEQFKQTGNVANIFNGFFISDRENPDGTGRDIDELELRLGISAAAGLDIGVASAFVGGGIDAYIFFDFHDNNDDGKIRGLELLDNTLLGLQDGLGPIHIFDVSGKLTAGLFVEVEVVGITETFEVATFDLFDFEFPRPDGEGFALATQNGGRLDLNIGDRADQRSDFILNTDVAETYRISAGTSPGTVIVEGFGRQQVFTAVNEIHGSAGLGNDVITVADNVTARVFLDGGAGDDTLIGGAGNDEITGGAGNDDLRGGGGADLIIGGDGADTLLGGDGDDDLRGGAGRDNLQGEAGGDTIDGGEGDDTVNGGDGDDAIDGGAGNDTIDAGAGEDNVLGGLGQDTIDGGDGGDTIDGGADDDTIFGGGGADTLRGGAGDDEVRGGIGNDEIFGDAGNDRLFGENSRDTIYGGAGNDLIEGGLAEDALYGGLGDDRLFANSSDTATVDPANHTLVGGGGNDLLIGAAFDPAGPFFVMTVFGDGVNDEMGNADPATDGDDTITTNQGDDVIVAGGGSDRIESGAGNDQIDAGAGSDIVLAGAGDDFVIGGLGDDRLEGGDGRDALIGGVSFNSVTPADFDPANLVNPVGVTGSTHTIVPTITAGLSIDGFAITGADDGVDTLLGEAGGDWLFGGSAIDRLYGGAGGDYLDGGLGDETVLLGEEGDDVIRGGEGDDLLRGGAGIDILLGDEGQDKLYGDEAFLGGVRQQLFGGDGADELFAWAPDGASGLGDMLFGGAGNDVLRGNTLDEYFDGGDGNDRVFGDILSGSSYGINAQAATTGGSDLIFGGAGEDQLFGGGGDDTIFGGADSDNIEGQAGSDLQYGGSGIDRFFAPTRAGHNVGTDVIDGHFGNAAQGDVPDDNATDMLVIDGTSGADTIVLSQIDATGQLFVTHPNGSLTIDWLDGSTPLVEQFQVAGHGGNDTIGFGMASAAMGPAFDLASNPALRPIDFSPLQNRSDFVGVFDGGGGDDVLVGAAARDRLDGGLGSDMLFGLGEDDRLYGDGGDGLAGDFDALFAGGGNDDLIGGQGNNALFAWSVAPDPALAGDIASLEAALPGFIANGPSADFGVSLDNNGAPIQGTGGGLESFEDTGINRVIGQQRDDVLFGGSLVDFLYGNGGNDTLINRSGTPFETLDEGQAGDAWKQYAQASDAVWYVSGSNANDKIDLNFVTEPGLLTDHHLVTRLTENNGQFTFDASVRLDFSARDADGQLIWDANEVLNDANARLDAIETLESVNGDLSDEERAAQFAAVETATTDLVNGLLPPEGDFSVIVIDALGGRDEITVGPTVQKTVWIDAGDDDDVVTIQGGNAILIDKTEDNATAGGVRGRNDAPAQAFDLGVLSTDTRLRIDNLTIDNPDDVDWYAFSAPDTLEDGRTLTLPTLGVGDDLFVQVFSVDDTSTPIFNGTGFNGVNLNALVAGQDYLIRIDSNNRVPTRYGLDFAFDAGLSGQSRTVDLGRASTADQRRDVILGGEGDDILTGGAGEDFIFGNAGNDVLIGGKDRGASDLLFGGAGDDTYQVVPDQLPQLRNGPETVFTPDAEFYLPANSDQFIDTEGTDRILFLGGDLDRRGFEVPDFAAMRYNTVLHRYEFASLVWDIGNQEFMTQAQRQQLTRPDYAPSAEELNTYATDFYFFQARGVESTTIDLGEGDDVFHADTDFRFTRVDGTPLTETWGVDLGDYEQGGTALNLTILGGGGDDQLFGGALADTIKGGEGDDDIQGGAGNDDIEGGGGADTIFGNIDTGHHAGQGAAITPRLPGQTVSGVDKFLVQFPGLDPGLFVFPTERYNFVPGFPFFTAPPTLPGVTLAPNGSQVFINDSYAILGSTTGERLGGIRSIGDFNGDGSEDWIVVGEQRAYIFTSAIQTDFLLSAELAADYIVDLTGLGDAGLAKFARSFADLDGNGTTDLAYAYENNGDAVAQVLLFDGTAALPRVIDADYIASLPAGDKPTASTPLELLPSSPAGIAGPDWTEAIQLDVVDFFYNDGAAALVVSTSYGLNPDGFFDSRETTVPWVGVVYSGADLLAGDLTVYDRAGTILTDGNSNTPLGSGATHSGNRLDSGNLTFINAFGSADGPVRLVIDGAIIATHVNATPSVLTGDEAIRIAEDWDIELDFNHLATDTLPVSPNDEDIFIDMAGVTTPEQLIDYIDQYLADLRAFSPIYITRDNIWVDPALDTSNPGGPRLRFTSLEQVTGAFSIDESTSRYNLKQRLEFGLVSIDGEQVGPLGFDISTRYADSSDFNARNLVIEAPAPPRLVPNLTGTFNLDFLADNFVGNEFTFTLDSDPTLDELIAELNSQVQAFNTTVTGNDQAFDLTFVAGQEVGDPGSGVSETIRVVSDDPISLGSMTISSRDVYSNLLFGGADAGTGALRTIFQSQPGSFGTPSAVSAAGQLGTVPAAGQTTNYYAQPIDFDFRDEVPMAIGDVDRGGTNDLAVYRERPDGGVYLSIFSGESAVPTGGFAVNSSEAIIQLNNPLLQGPDARVNGVASGDFDGDGAADLAVSITSNTINGVSTSVQVYFDLDDRLAQAGGATLVVDALNPDLLLRGEFPNDAGFGHLLNSTPMDINRDGLDDLIISDTGQDGVSGLSSVAEGGKVYIVYGTPRDASPQPGDTVEQLSNFAVPGSGSYLVERGAGQAERFDNGGKRYTLDGTRAQYFRFSTLGDATAEHTIRLADADSGVTAQLLNEDYGQIVAHDRSAFGLQGLEAGTYVLRVTGPADARFAIEVNAPIAGASFESETQPDADRIDGQDGDDILVGQDDLDVLVGGSGADAFFGEVFENGDVSSADTVNPVDASELYLGPAAEINPLLTDPAMIATLLNDSDVGFLSQPVSTATPPTGILRESDLKSITSLSAPSYFNTLASLENLQTLSINDLSQGDNLMPLGGLAHLESLVLNDAAYLPVGTQLVVSAGDAFGLPSTPTNDDTLVTFPDGSSDLFALGSAVSIGSVPLGVSEVRRDNTGLGVNVFRVPLIGRNEAPQIGVADLASLESLVYTFKDPNGPLYEVFGGAQAGLDSVFLLDVNASTATEGRVSLDNSNGVARGVATFGFDITAEASSSTDLVMTLVRTGGTNPQPDSGDFLLGEDILRFGLTYQPAGNISAFGVSAGGLSTTVDLGPPFRVSPFESPAVTHRIEATIDFDNKLFSADLIRDIDGVAIRLNLLVDEPLPGLQPEDYRVGLAGFSGPNTAVLEVDNVTIDRQVFGPVPQPGDVPGGELLALYTFENTVAGDIDGGAKVGTFAGQTFDGLIIGDATLSTNVSGVNGGGQSLLLDGNGDFIDLPINAVNPFDGSQDYTITTWFRSEAAGNRIILSSSRDTNPDNHSMAFFQSQEIGSGVLSSDNFFVGAAWSGQTLTQGDGQWHFGAVIYDADTQTTRVHLDGLTSGAFAYNPAIPDVLQDTVRIGGSLNTAFPTPGDWQGNLDDLAIFSGVLSEVELAAVQRGDFSSFLSATFNEGDTITAQDIGQQVFGNDLTTTDANGDPTTTQIEVIDPQGVRHSLQPSSLNFDATRQTHVDTGRSLANGLVEVTTAGWVRPTAYGTGTVGLFGQDDAIQIQMGADGELRAFHQNSGSAFGSGAVKLPLNQWSHVAAVRTDTETLLFINGEPIAPQAHAQSDAAFNTSATFRIGGGVVNNSGTDYFTGQIDDVALFQRALTITEISELVAGEIDTDSPDLVGFWGMDAFGAAVVRDAAGANDGELKFTTGTIADSWSDQSPNPPVGFTFPDDGVYTLRITARDSHGASTFIERDMLVGNLPPLAPVLGGDVTDLGGGLPRYELQASGLGDPGSLDAQRLDILWEITSDATGQAVLTATGESVVFEPTVADHYTVRITATDPQGAQATTTELIEFSPSIDVTLDQTTIEEGGLVTATANILVPPATGVGYVYDWTILEIQGNQGTLVRQVFGDTSGVLTFRPVDDGEYEIQTVLRTTGNGPILAGFDVETLTVTDAVPTLTIIDGLVGTEGVAPHITLNLADPGGLDRYDLRVVWGDGQVTTLDDISAGEYGLTKPSAYAAPGDYALSIELSPTDDPAPLVQTPSTIVIENLAPRNVQASILSPVSAVVDGDTVTFQVGFTDDNAEAVFIDFGDGNGVGPVPPGDQVPHTYANSGTYTATFTVVDGEQRTGRDTLTVVVENLAPEIDPASLQVNGGGEVNHGTQARLTGSLTDFDRDVVAVSVDFGDGTRVPAIVTAPASATGSVQTFTFTASHIYDPADENPGAAVSRTVTVTALDSDGGLSSQQIQLDVLPVDGLPPIPGDTDGDGDIDDSDLGTSFANYTGPLAPGTGGKTFADGDTDGDGDVDDSDLGTSFSGYTGPLTPAMSSNANHQTPMPRAEASGALWLYQQQQTHTPQAATFSLFELNEDEGESGFSGDYDGMSERLLGMA